MGEAVTGTGESDLRQLVKGWLFALIPSACSAAGTEHPAGNKGTIPVPESLDSNGDRQPQMCQVGSLMPAPRRERSQGQLQALGLSQRKDEATKPTGGNRLELKKPVRH